MRVRPGWLMTLTCAAAFVVVWGTANATATRPGGGRGPACGPAHARTLAADKSARVYVRHDTVFGCARNGRGSFRLGTVSPRPSSEGRPGPIGLAGVDVAYGLTYRGVDMTSAKVVVRRLVDGTVLRHHAATTGNLPPESFQAIDDLVVKTDGSVAWIASAGSVISGHTQRTQVEKSDRTQRSLLDESSRIRVHSLRLQGSRLSWRDGSATRSAKLR